MRTTKQLFEQSYIPVVRTITQPRLRDYGELRVKCGIDGLDSVYLPADEVIPVLHYDGRKYLDARLAKTGHTVGYNGVPTSVIAVNQDDGSIINVDPMDNGPFEVRITYEWREGVVFVLNSTLDRLLQEQSPLRRVS